MKKVNPPVDHISPNENIITKSFDYPYLVVRIMSAVYQHEKIEVREGEPAVQIGRGKCFVQYPKPRLANNEISEGCRELLIAAVKASVKKTKFRMCIVWGKSSKTFVELDGVTHESK